MTGNEETYMNNFDVYLNVEEQMKGQKIRIKQTAWGGSYCYGWIDAINCGDKESFTFHSQTFFSGELDLPSDFDELRITFQAYCYLHEIQPVVDN